MRDIWSKSVGGERGRERLKVREVGRDREDKSEGSR